MVIEQGDGGIPGQKTTASAGVEFWEGVRRRRVLLEDSGDAKAGSGREAMRRRLGARGVRTALRRPTADELDGDEATGGDRRG
ncbi:unnamed protein product [Linum trigynum]|uniref:Uncharacterized protein n=1 Tax=Linum trigynum TaxID=586398 RepID=A0AAV2E1K3_9ROSI